MVQMSRRPIYGLICSTKPAHVWSTEAILWFNFNNLWLYPNDVIVIRVGLLQLLLVHQQSSRGDQPIAHEKYWATSEPVSF